MSANTLTTAALAGLEAAINRALALDPTTPAKLTDLGDKVFHLQLSQPELELWLRTSAEQVSLQQHYEGEVTTSLRGSLSDFIAVAQADDSASALINGEVELHGDSSALIELQKMIASLELDWEAPLVELLGDVAGHQLAEAIRLSHSWASEARRSLHNQIEDYLREESGLFPAEWEVDNFCDDVSKLRADTDRLEARIRRLRLKLDEGL